VQSVVLFGAAQVARRILNLYEKEAFLIGYIEIVLSFIVLFCRFDLFLKALFYLIFAILSYLLIA
jgi:hypothetical protein